MRFYQPLRLTLKVVMVVAVVVIMEAGDEAVGGVGEVGLFQL